MNNDRRKRIEEVKTGLRFMTIEIDRLWAEVEEAERLCDELEAGLNSDEARA